MVVFPFRNIRRKTLFHVTKVHKNHWTTPSTHYKFMGGHRIADASSRYSSTSMSHPSPYPPIYPSHSISKLNTNSRSRLHQTMTRGICTTRNTREPLRTLYPEIEPYHTEQLKVDEIHTLFIEESGNPNGAPVVVLHGGPGGGCLPSYRQYFDPEFYRIVCFDQRGAGRSTPHACLENNTTWHLVDDIEKIRLHLKINKWHAVFGGSWGSTLAVAYAETYPEAVGSLILRGIFMLRREELQFFYQGPGSNFYFPDVWEEFIKPIPESQRGDMMFAYYQYLTGNDENRKLECAKAWTIWEMSTSRLLVDQNTIARAAEESEEAKHFALAFARIECHYFVHAGFFEKDGQLLLNAHRLKDIPTEIVSGRYDTVCPIKSSWDLHKAVPHSNLTICPMSGHSMKEDEILSELVRITDQYRKLKVE